MPNTNIMHVMEYISKSARTFGESLNEHLRAPSPIYDHTYTTDQYGQPVL